MDRKWFTKTSVWFFVYAVVLNIGKHICRYYDNDHADDLAWEGAQAMFLIIGSCVSREGISHFVNSQLGMMMVTVHMNKEGIIFRCAFEIMMMMISFYHFMSMESMRKEWDQEKWEKEKTGT